MSLFIHKENQTLLWQLIHETPLWTAFEQIYRSHVELWFRNIISQFYDKYWEKYSTQPMSVSELKQINKEVIAFMIADIKKTVSPAYVSSSSSSVHSLPPPSTIFSKPGEIPDALKSVRVVKENETTEFSQTIISRIAEYDKPPSLQHTPVYVSSSETLSANTTHASSVSVAAAGSASATSSTYLQLAETYNVEKEKEEKVKKAQMEFDQFQRRYSAGFERKPPPPIDFSEQLDSEKIKNMDELIQQQLAEREKDLEGIPLANIS